MEEYSLRLQNRVSSIIKALEIQGESSAKNLIKAIDYFKNASSTIKNNVPIDFGTWRILTDFIIFHCIPVTSRTKSKTCTI